MRDEHIISILESAPLSGLGESELAAVRAHTRGCAECRRAYRAAQISTLLLRERAAETFEPSPFFQTRVLAALRERQAGAELSGFRRLWKAAGALVSSMAVTVAALAALTFIPAGAQIDTVSQEVAAVNLYSAEDVLLEQADLASDQMSYEQVLTTLYGSDEDAAR
jgi:hypothetical protein